jgi:hypothetical protein
MTTTIVNNNSSNNNNNGIAATYQCVFGVFLEPKSVDSRPLLWLYAGHGCHPLLVLLGDFDEEKGCHRTVRVGVH